MNVHAASFPPQVDMKESPPDSEEEEDSDDDDKDDGLPRYSKKQKRNKTVPPKFAIWKSAVWISFVSSNLNSNLTSFRA